VAKRRETRRILTERDMEAAGLVDADTATKAGKLLNVQALIVSKLTIHVDITKSTRTTYVLTEEPVRNPPPTGVKRDRGNTNRRQPPPNRNRPPPSRQPQTRTTLQPREVEEIARTLTVQCRFSMLDAATGQSFIEYAPKPFQKTDEKKPSKLFGRSASEADLDPVDLYIGELVEQAVREFVTRFVPRELERSYKMKASEESPAATGIRLMRADDFSGALEQFKQAMMVDGEDDKPVFYAGVAAEMAGDHEKALDYYRRAAAMPGVGKDDLEVYLEAKERLTEHAELRR
jgi:HSP20 family molecular chaperone IbpA